MRRIGVLVVVGLLGLLAGCGGASSDAPQAPQILRTVAANSEIEALRAEVDELESQLAECREAIEAGTSAFDDAESEADEINDVIGNPPHWDSTDDSIDIIQDWVSYYRELGDAAPDISAARSSFDLEASDCD